MASVGPAAKSADAKREACEAYWHHWPKGSTWWGHMLPYRESGEYYWEQPITPQVAGMLAAWIDAIACEIGRIKSDDDCFRSAVSMEAVSQCRDLPYQKMLRVGYNGLGNESKNVVDGDAMQNRAWRKQVISIIGSNCEGDKFVRMVQESPRAIAYLHSEGFFRRFPWSQSGIQSISPHYERNDNQ